jgi:hypothetical protein
MTSVLRGGSMTVVLLGLLLGAGTAHAEQWKCTYTGQWSTRGSSDAGTFAWALKWVSGPAGWKVLGDYTDKYGYSYLDGLCANKVCQLNQHYKSGRLAGKWYYWQGTYTDRFEGPNRTINTFVGTWGYTPANRAAGGPWSATAICVRQ